MRTNPSPEGYYTKPGAAALEWAYLCPPKKYCANGTGDGKQKQRQCLNGFYCPMGTAGTLQLDGTFAPGIHMVARDHLMDLIRELIGAKKEELRYSEYAKRYGLRQKLNEALNELDKARPRDGAAVLKANYSFLRQDWDVKKWLRLNATIENRKVYLEELERREVCDEDR